MEPNTMEPKPNRTLYQSPTIAHLGELEQVTLNINKTGTDDTFTSILGDLTEVLES